MNESMRTRRRSILAVITVAASLMTLRAGAGPAPLDGACCNVSLHASAGLVAGGLNVGVPCAELNASFCELLNGTYAGNGTTCASGICDATPTSTATATATATETPTRAPQGADCATPSQCTTDFCADGVCCDTACTDPDQSCNQLGQVGVCAAVASPAPAASPTGLLLMIGALALVGLAAMYLRRRGA
jgi:hypothetical protein